MSITFVDRESRYPNRYKVTKSNGTSEYVTLERADEPTVVGTPLNAATLNMVTSKEWNAVLLANAWSDEAPYTQTVTVANIQQEDRPHVGAVYSDDLETALAQKESWAMVDDIESDDGIVTFTCFEDKPSVDIPIQIEVNH